MGLLKSKLWPNSDAENHSKRERKSNYIVSKYDDIPIMEMNIEYSSPKFTLTEKPLNDDKFERVLRLHQSSKRVEIIELRNCDWVSKIPVTIELYTGLTELDLQGNGIEEIPWALVRLQKTLRKLNLSNNVVEHIPRFISRLVHLTELDLSDNDVRDLPSEMLSLRELVILNLKQNPKLNFPSAEVCMNGKDAIFEALESRNSRRDLWRDTRRHVGFSQGGRGPPTLHDVCCNCIIRYNVNFTEPKGLLPPALTEHLLQVKDTYFRVAKCSMCSGFFSCEDAFDRHVCKRIQ